MANSIRKIICDLSSYQKRCHSSCAFKVEYIKKVSYEFLAPYEPACEDTILVYTPLGYFKLVDRELDGRKGTLDLSAAPLPGGKVKVIFESASEEMRRAAVIVETFGRSDAWEYPDQGSL